MSIQDWGAIGDIGGAIAVIVTLIYLARQIRQSNRIAIASTEMGVRNAFGSINESIYSNPEVADLFAKATNADAQLTPSEEVRVLNIVLRLLNSWLAIETAYINGMVPRDTYDLIEDNICVVLDLYPGTWNTWRQAVDGFPALSERKVFRIVRSLLEERA